MEGWVTVEAASVCIGFEPGAYLATAAFLPAAPLTITCEHEGVGATARRKEQHASAITHDDREQAQKLPRQTPTHAEAAS